MELLTGSRTIDLGLPEGTVLRAIDYDRIKECFRIYIVHPSFPERPEGGVVQCIGIYT